MYSVVLWFSDQRLGLFPSIHVKVGHIRVSLFRISRYRRRSLELMPTTMSVSSRSIEYSYAMEMKCAYLGAWRTYLAIASRNRYLYSLGLVTVGRFRPPPAKPRSLIQDSSFLSQVYVRIQSMIPTTSSLR